MYSYIYMYIVFSTEEAFISPFPANRTAITANLGDSVNLTFIVETAPVSSPTPALEILMNGITFTSDGTFHQDPLNDQIMLFEISPLFSFLRGLYVLRISEQSK